MSFDGNKYRGRRISAGNRMHAGGCVPAGSRRSAEERTDAGLRMFVRRRMHVLAAAVILLCVLLLACSCGQEKNEKAVYTITAEGSAEESGVITFAGMDMNVYRDPASNPCGDCPDQPVSIYVGTGAEDTIAAMAEAVERADDIWEVTENSGTKLVLQEKTAGSVTKEPELSAPAGLTLTGEFHAAGTMTVSGDPGSAENDSSSKDAESRERKTITNIDGSEMEVFADEPQSIAAIYGPAYEALVVLGAEDRISVCADVQFENFPWAQKVFSRITELPYLKNVHSSVSTEELKTYDPDLALTFNRPNELKQLEALDIPAVYGVTSQSLSDVKDQLFVYAEAAGGGAEERAQAYADYFDEKLKTVTDVTSQIPDSERPSVYYAGIDILTTYGKYSDISEVIEAAGGRSVTADLDAGNHTQINFEQLASWNPDYIFIDHGSMNDRETVEEIKETTAGNEKYAAISAVKNDQIYLTPSGVFYWDMGLQKILLVMYMAKTIHPEEFAGLDMEQEVMDFYSEFYGYDLTREEARQILAREDPS